MLYTYKYTENHIIEKLQKYIEFFFENMFREDVIIFSNDLIHVDFKDIVNECNKLEDLLKDIFIAFKKVDKKSQNLIIQGFKNNNLIDKLCTGEVEPIHYNDIPTVLSKNLKDLFKYLYKNVLNTITFTSKHCDMKTHFNTSRNLNIKYKFCPFCGLYRLDSPFDKSRDAYDHYLPKTKYPFNSVNFRNLVPICDKCNSTYKKAKDPLFKDDDKTKRRKAFYPFDNLMDSMSFKLYVVEQGVIPIIDDVFSIHISSTLGRSEEIDSWDDIFEIKTRYIAEIKYKLDDWLINFYQFKYKKEKDKPGFDFNAMLEEYLNDLKDSSLSDQNFLKAVTFELLASEYDFEELLNKISSIK